MFKSKAKPKRTQEEIKKHLIEETNKEFEVRFHFLIRLIILKGSSFKSFSPSKDTVPDIEELEDLPEEITSNQAIQSLYKLLRTFLIAA